MKESTNNIQELINFLKEVVSTRCGVYFEEAEYQELLLKVAKAECFRGADPNDPALYIDPYDIADVIEKLEKYLKEWEEDNE